MSTLSVCILALNEAARIEQTLQSIKDLADEIIVTVDDHSTDNTESIAKLFTDQVFIRKHEDSFHKNKQWTVDQATSDWILWLDGDEVLTPELKSEIREIIKTQKHESTENTKAQNTQDHENNQQFNNLSIQQSDLSQVSNLKSQVTTLSPNPYPLTPIGYYLPRKNILFGHWIQHAGWYPDYQLRLFKQGTVHWPAERIHEHPAIQGETANLTHPLEHYNYDSISHFLEKLNKYTSQDAGYYAKELRPPYAKTLLIKPIDDFIKRFLAYEGYKDGLVGLTICLLQAFYELVVVAKAIELKKFDNTKSTNLIQLIEETAVTKAKEWYWWRWEGKIQSATNRLVKNAYKLGRRLNLS